MITGNITDFNRKMYILFRYGKNTVFFLFTLPLSIILLLVVRSIYPLIIVRMGWLKLPPILGQQLKTIFYA